MNFGDALVEMKTGIKFVRGVDRGMLDYVRAKKLSNGLWSLVYAQHGFKNEYPYKPNNSDIFADDWEQV